ASRLAALRQGSITVASEPGEGSTFTFTAKLGRGRRQEVPALAPPPGLRVLIVDDNTTSRETLERWLRSWSLEVTAVGDGLSALDALWHGVASTRPFRLVLLDAGMHGVDGATVAARIRERGELDHAGILMMTSGDLALDDPPTPRADFTTPTPLLQP